eukprot:gnl/TRDRNA2_/TRDRNA2_55454_c0_seq1.p1 gnl/TRDRNA2_/TRDRNA2_55454_c0~~gnl/TRDRNA2_/TRDRNA2_55454_c0_seq1.p1  ORF type:complete len:332 (-),score=65.83 gnl/TRDRNA2_/TRDRNA2_55454_c0_seq1:30-1025(-)
MAAPTCHSFLTSGQVAAQAPETVERLLAECDAFLFDCDGTLYHAGSALPHVAEAIQHLRSLGKKLFFVTNTSSRSREQLQAKLQGLGVRCEAAECVPSGVFTAHYVRRMHPAAERVYVIGGQGLIDELAKVGIASSGGPSEDKAVFTEDAFCALAEEVGAKRYDGVVVGWDTSINYHKIAKSSLVFQQHPAAFFYATNDDPADRVGQWLLPGNGPLLSSIEAACAACASDRVGRAKPWGVKAEVLGKPNPAYARLIAEWEGIDLTRAVMVGDRLDTDILMAKEAGMKSLFVLTGVDDLRQVTQKGIEPEFVLPEVGSLWTARCRGGLMPKL